MSPTLKFWFCKVELDTQVLVPIDRFDANKSVLFFIAFTSTADPESVYPKTILAVQGTLHLQEGNVPISVAEMLLLLIIINDFEKPPVTARASAAVPTVLAKDAVVAKELLKE